VAADFNHDGKMDLATDDGSVIRIYTGQGDGTFTPGLTYSTIPNSGLLTATDLDGDGNIDLWTGYGGNGIYSGDGYLPNVAYALMGKGDGTFAGTSGLPATLALESAILDRVMSDASSTLSLTPVPSTITVVAGQISPPFVVVLGTTTVQSASMACSGLPIGAACIFPGSPTSNPGQVGITIATTASGMAIPSSRISPPKNWIATGCSCISGFLAVFVLLLRITRRNLKWSFSVFLLVTMATLFTGCSSNSSSTSSGGTPAGTYSVTITALINGTLVSTANPLTLKVIQ
jgi:hypothetical protein